MRFIYFLDIFISVPFQTFGIRTKNGKITHVCKNAKIKKEKNHKMLKIK